MERNFKFAFGQSVLIEASGETAEVIAAASYATAEDQFLLRYCDATGTAREQWWGESALQVIGA